MKRVMVCLGLGIVLLVAACATPDARIRRNQALFDTYPEDVQHEIRAGRVNLGFAPDMVAMALGEPDRKYQRRTAEGTVEVWSYTEYHTTSQRRMVDGRFRVRDGGGRVHSVNDAVWIDVPTHHEFDRLRVEFHDGTVSAIESLGR